MTILCPHCHAPESECRELLAACRGRKAAARLLYARAEVARLQHHAARAAGRNGR